MVIDTRSAPEFPHDCQRELYNIRREFALMVKFPYDAEYEQQYVGAMTAERASEALARTTGELKAYKRRISKNQNRKSKGKATEIVVEPMNRRATRSGPTNPGDGDVSEDTPANESATDENPEHTDGETDNESANENDSDSPSSSSSSESDSDDGDDPRRHTSKKDKQTVRGRTPRIDIKGRTTKKLFKMDPPEKYSGEKTDERTYEAVHQFLSQLSRYFRLATHIDMDADITEYVLGFLKGFAYRWFEALDKGNQAFRWQEFESAFRTKFIPREHVQMALTKYLAIKQNGRSVSEFMVERESLENTLGDVISSKLKETSFRKNLDLWLREKLVTFRDLSYEQYKLKAEATDQDMREQKLGPYSMKRSDTSMKPSSSRGNSSRSAKPNEKPKPDTKRDEPSKNQMRKEGLCFTCKKQGHMARDCPQNENKPETNSIRIAANADAKTKVAQYSKRDGRSYSDVVSNKLQSKVYVPTIAIPEEPHASPKPPPMMTTIVINGVPAKTLIDTGSSDDFVGTHFVTTNRVSVQKHENPLSIQ